MQFRDRPTTRRARSGERVVIVGYPQGMLGVGADGLVQSSPGTLQKQLLPIYVFGQVESIDPLTVHFTAGMVPMSGMSGSPVWSEDGALLGLYVGLDTTEAWLGIEFIGRCQALGA
jgi:hypothetical protein